MARLVGVVVGLLFGLVMSVSNLFVITVKAATACARIRRRSARDRRQRADARATGLPCCRGSDCRSQYFTGIGRWHGLADGIRAHRTDNELDIRAGFGSTLAALLGRRRRICRPVRAACPFRRDDGSALRQTMDASRQRMSLSDAVAGAIAAGFNAPIAGVVFAHEAILRHWLRHRSDCCSISHPGSRTGFSAPRRCLISPPRALT